MPTTLSTVILDACVLYPAPLRDLLMHLSLAGLFHARWTDQIHDEWINNLLANRKDITRGQLERTRELMNTHAYDCLVKGYEGLIPSLSLPDSNDRHVLAAAIQASANIIVTYNLSDFPITHTQQYNVEAQHPDDFVTHLIDLAPGPVCSAILRLRKSLKHPPITAAVYLGTLERQSLPETANRLKAYIELI